MCRIYGHFNGAVAPRELRTVAALQRHGGPDGHGNAFDGTWAIGANRLAIIDLDGGRQPYQLAGGGIKVVFNGEIYNHKELRRDLRQRGFDFADRCDGSILPALYQAYGDEFTEHLDGMYAVAVLDQRAEEPRLVLATDHAGMKPLYYRWDAASGALYFSSEIPALLAYDAVSPAMWTHGLDAYLATKTPFGERTMFADIRVFPPGTTATCDRATGLRMYRRERPVGATRSPREAAELAAEVRELLREESRRLKVADVPVATITSGGLDSSLVTAFAGDGDESLHTFNIAYRGTWPGDERLFARQVAERAGATYHQVEIDPTTFPDMLADVVWHLGQPNADPITLSTYALFAAVREAGFTVALTGDAADETFGGYGRMRAVAEAEAAGRPWFDGYLDALAVLPAAERALLYTDEYAVELKSAEPTLPESATGELRGGGGSALRRVMAFELRYRLPAYHLRRVDHLSMAHSVEARLPYCQRALVDLGRTLPDELLIGEGRVKRTLYGAAQGLLPSGVLHRPKQPFTLPITAMLAPGWPLWEFAQDMLGSRRLCTDGQVRPDVVRRLFAKQASRPDDTAALTLWALLVHEVWREQFRPRTRWMAGAKALAS